MDEIDRKVLVETDHLILVRTRVMAVIVALGIIGGEVIDLSLDRYLAYPHRRLVDLGGLLAMMGVFYVTRHWNRIASPRRIAFGAATVLCIFMLVLSNYAGPDREMVTLLAFTVITLGTAILLPWGIGLQVGLVVIVWIAVHISLYLLYGRPVLLDPSVGLALFTASGLSCFVAFVLERGRLTLARQRHQLADQKDLAERQRAAAEEQKAKAEALARDLDAYAHAVAHDLKNPIHVIFGYADLLETHLDGRMDDEVRDLLTQTSKGCQKMAQIIDELLLLASVRKMGRVPRDPLDMSRVVTEARHRFANLIEESGAEVIVPAEWPQALGHAPWVEEVWANYISNAIKYGGTPPRIELGANRDGHGRVHFWVRDNGQGLDKEQLGQLFQEFSRMTPADGEGHGLGLSIVKRIVERLGGEVRVSSSIGQGSTFGFTLPA